MVDGQFDEPVAESSVRAARMPSTAQIPAAELIYYFNPDTATSAWIWSRPLIKVIGKHRFAKNRTGCACPVFLSILFSEHRAGGSGV